MLYCARDMMPGYASLELIALAKQKREETSKLKILWIKKRDYRNGIKRKETRLARHTLCRQSMRSVYITKGCKANSYT